MLSRFTASMSVSPTASIDLHMHTTYSDGRWPASKLITYLADRGFDLIAVTDHNRVDKIAEIQALGAERKLPVLPAVEMSTAWNGPVGRGCMGDLLCYGFDPLQNQIAPVAEKILRQQLENTYEVNGRLRSQGYTFPRQEEILAGNQGKLSSPGDNVRLLREHGYVSDWQEAYDLILSAGFTSVLADMAETVEAVHQSGGVCLIAHPGRREAGFTFYDPDLLDQVFAEIPLDGIELIHPTHSQEMIGRYREYIDAHHLLCSTGSDSHCSPTRMPVKHQAEISRRLLEHVGVTFTDK